MRAQRHCQERRLGQFVYSLVSPEQALRAPSFWVGGLTVFVLLSFLDLCLTWLLIEQNEGRIFESNPIANAWLAQFGWSGLLLFKLAAMTVVIGAVTIIARYHRVKAALILLFACLTLGGVAFHSKHLLDHPPHRSDVIGEEPLMVIVPPDSCSQSSSAPSPSSRAPQPGRQPDSGRGGLPAPVPRRGSSGLSVIISSSRPAP